MNDMNPSPSQQPEPSAGPEQKTEEPKAATFADNVFYWLQSLTLAVVSIVLVFTFVGRFTRVVGDSMVGTLQNGDMMLVWELGYTPRAGDIVVLNKTTQDTVSLLGGKAIVKRVIATEGQLVELDYEAGLVYVDGVALDEPYLPEPMTARTGEHFQQTTFLVPEGHIFVLGDNRNASTDSRHDQVGTIDVQYVLGKAICVIFPLPSFQIL